MEYDINSLTDFSAPKDETYSKNRVMRVLDEIGTTVKSTWEKSYMGKVTNNEQNRANFRVDLDNYFKQLEGIDAIQEYVSSGGIDNISISQGDDLDQVVVEVYVKPCDSMEFLYLTCNVQTA